VTDPRKLIQEARELDAKATKGPWTPYRCHHVYDANESCEVRGFGTSGVAVTIFGDGARDECHHIVGTADAAFIAHSRTLLVELADALEKALEGSDVD